MYNLDVRLSTFCIDDCSFEFLLHVVSGPWSEKAWASFQAHVQIRHNQILMPCWASRVIFPEVCFEFMTCIN